MNLLFSFFTKYFVLPIFRLSLIKRVEGKENIPKDTNFIVAANHQNSLDHWIVVYPFKDRLREIHFLGKMEGFLMKIFVGWLYFLSGTISFNLKRKERKKVIFELTNLLKNGKIIIIYPEGNVNKEKVLLKGKTGVAELSLKSNLPVVPVGFSSGRRRVLKVGRPLFFSKAREEFKNLKEDSQEYFSLLKEVTDKIMIEISNLCGKSYKINIWK